MRSHFTARKAADSSAAVESPGPSDSTGAAAVPVLNACLSLLDAERSFADHLTGLLTDIAVANVFQLSLASELSSRLHTLQRQRESLQESRAVCQRQLAAQLGCRPSEVRMSELERFLPPPMQADFRCRRLDVLARLEHAQQLLLRTDILLTSRTFLFADVIEALTGQSPSAQCYGANGRRGSSMSFSILEAVS